MSNWNLKLRKETDYDKELLLKIYGSTRSDELALVTFWNESQKRDFIFQQFTAQTDYYKKVYPDADYSIILANEMPAGRLYVERSLIEHNIRIIDIALLPEFRNKGIGQYFLKQIQEESKNSNKVLSIHVEKFNRALQLYLRLGFEIIEEANGLYLLMQWTSK